MYSEDELLTQSPNRSDGGAAMVARISPEQQCIPGPPRIKYIIVSELCERFSFYGLRAILVLYMTEKLGFGDDRAVAVFAYSSALCYFCPLVGSYVADAVCGPFFTILVFSMLYVLGGVTLSLTSMDGSEAGLYVALLLIGLGTGGIKPCVSPFGAAQLEDLEEPQRSHTITRYFQVFYFAINLGSTASFFLTPLIRINYGKK